ncbi:MAG: hypothetical protein ACXWCY_20760 [Burkholderiales bacterium]
MPQYVLRVSPTTACLRDADRMHRVERHAMNEVRHCFPEVEWLANFVTGPNDYVEIFSARDLETAVRVSDRIRDNGLLTELWPLARAQNEVPDAPLTQSKCRER